MSSGCPSDGCVAPDRKGTKNAPHAMCGAFGLDQSLEAGSAVVVAVVIVPVVVIIVVIVVVGTHDDT